MDKIVMVPPTVLHTLSKKMVLWLGMEMLFIFGATAYINMYIFNEHKCEIMQKYVYMQLD